MKAPKPAMGREGPARARPWLAAAGPPTLTDKEFRLFQELIHRETGIYISGIKRTLLVGRLHKRLRLLGIHSFLDYYNHVVRGDDEERLRMFDCVSTNETHFFREPRQFVFIEDQVLPEWTAAAAAGRRPRRIRAWSAACSTGEEPFSLAMLLLSHFPSGSGWDIQILGSDLSNAALDRARRAVWPVAKAAEIPPRHLKRFMLRGTRSQEGKMMAGPELRAAVRFERINLNDPSYDPGGPFDLILCRNVLIYFKKDAQRHVVDRLIGHLDPAGYLFLGHAESMAGMSLRLWSVGPATYGLARPAAQAGAR